ncbi:MAG: hypothetical protein KAR07_06300 [Spirochaetes bacterium]|nr:hypothetical protein [Spirochaetota bacterium]
MPAGIIKKTFIIIIFLQIITTLPAKPKDLIKIVTKDTAVLIGYIERENQTSIFIRNKYGLFEIKRQRIKKVIVMKRYKVKHLKKIKKVTKIIKKQKKLIPEKIKRKQNSPSPFIIGGCLHIPFTIGEFNGILSSNPGLGLSLRYIFNNDFSLNAQLIYGSFKKVGNENDKMTGFSLIMDFRWTYLIFKPAMLYTWAGIGYGYFTADLPSQSTTARGFNVLMHTGLGISLNVYKDLSTFFDMPFLTFIFEQSSILITWGFYTGLELKL